MTRKVRSVYQAVLFSTITLMCGIAPDGCAENELALGAKLAFRGLLGQNLDFWKLKMLCPEFWEKKAGLKTLAQVQRIVVKNGPEWQKIKNRGKC